MLKSQSQVHAQLPCCNTPFMNTVSEVIYLSFGIVYISTITKNDWRLVRTCEPQWYAFQHSTFSRVEKWMPLFEYLLHTHPRFGLMFPLHIPEAKRRSSCEKMKTFMAVQWHQWMDRMMCRYVENAEMLVWNYKKVRWR